jgi:hypothetical protein
MDSWAAKFFPWALSFLISPHAKILNNVSLESAQLLYKTHTDSLVKPSAQKHFMKNTEDCFSCYLSILPTVSPSSKNSRATSFPQTWQKPETVTKNDKRLWTTFMLIISLHQHKPSQRPQFSILVLAEPSCFTFFIPQGLR